ncbi:MAG: hypothetical protein PVF85_10325, partial [Anaerolineales bacterium]
RSRTGQEISDTRSPSRHRVRTSLTWTTKPAAAIERTLTRRNVCVIARESAFSRQAQGHGGKQSVGRVRRQ